MMMRCLSCCLCVLRLTVLSLPVQLLQRMTASACLVCGKLAQLHSQSKLCDSARTLQTNTTVTSHVSMPNKEGHPLQHLSLYFGQSSTANARKPDLFGQNVRLSPSASDRIPFPVTQANADCSTFINQIGFQRDRRSRDEPCTTPKYNFHTTGSRPYDAVCLVLGTALTSSQ